MNSKPLPLKGAYLIDSEPFKDHRGWFYRAFCFHEVRDLLGGRQIMQINISLTETVGAIRGLHFQYPPHGASKLAGEAVEISGDGSQTRDFIYTTDLIQAIRLATAIPTIGGEVFQIATSREHTVNEVAELLKKPFYRLFHRGLPCPMESLFAIPSG